MKKHLSFLKTALVVGVAAAADVANAALPTAATDALTSASTAVSDSTAAVWPVIGAVLVAGITIKLVKRFSNKI